MFKLMSLTYCSPWIDFAVNQLKHFPPHTYGEFYEANEGHEAIAILTSIPNANVNVITQNIDGLHRRTRHEWNHEDKLIEAHGRLGLYKCIPEVDSDRDVSDDDSEAGGDQRKVIIGSRRKQKLLQKASNDRSAGGVQSNGDMKPAARDSNDASALCKYAFEESIPANMIEPSHVRNIISGIYNEGSSGSSFDSDYILALQLHSSLNGRKRVQKKLANGATQPDQMLINEPPLCPSCHRPILPQALQFDESYHSHGHYQFERMEQWIERSSVIVFVGTSFAVSLTKHALEHARRESKVVYNFNIDSEGLETSSWMNAANVTGDVQRTLPELVNACEEEFASLYE
jgi:NAD-dependent SIR2 family protein deacetylase